MSVSKPLTLGLALALALSVQVNAEVLCDDAFDEQLRAVRKLTVKGQATDARVELAKARGMPMVAGCPAASVALALREVEILLKEGNLADADRLVHKIQQAPPESKRLAADLLHNVGMIAYNLGQFERARESYQQLEILDRQRGDLFNLATDIYNIATTYLADPPDGQMRDRAVSELRRALTAAKAAKHRDIEAQVHLELGKLSEGEEAVQHLEACRALATIPLDVTGCLGALAVARMSTDPLQAQQLVVETVELAEQAAKEGDPWPLIYRWSERMLVNWEVQPRDRAIAESLTALRHIEELREQQRDSIAQAGLFSLWAEAYHWLAGRLLSLGGDSPNRNDTHLAFIIEERYRARSLFDSLESAGVVPGSIVQRPIVQRPIVQGPIPQEPSTQEPSTQESNTVESGSVPAPEDVSSSESQEEQDLTLVQPAFPGLKDRRFASLADVEAHLAPDEAMLSFQVAPWKDVYGRFGGGSWLIAITRSGSRVYKLPGRRQISHKVKAHLGLLDQRDKVASELAAKLYEELVGPAIADLPPGIDKLITIPDGDLHLLPFGTLRASPETAPLAVTHQISMVPSATLWLRWTKSSTPIEKMSALILADPQLPEVAEVAGATITRDRPAQLEHALAEGEAVRTYMGSSSKLLSGAGASEAVLKQQLKASDNEFGLVHFAAHAVVDGNQPELSAVLLAADSERPADSSREDGSLQIWEIVDLSLEGRMIVLSACSSASGSVLKGEGVMSLARAFFQAGANTVVGSLWPLGDREALELFDEFYRHLTRGTSVREALQQAQKAMIAAGKPASAWAGVVVIGDGARVPVTARQRIWMAAWALAAIVLLVYGVLVSRRRRNVQAS